jgi:hypothetical protein
VGSPIFAERESTYGLLVKWIEWIGSANSCSRAGVCNKHYGFVLELLGVVEMAADAVCG